jgi:hypothetical protein
MECLNNDKAAEAVLGQDVVVLHSTLIVFVVCRVACRSNGVSQTNPPCANMTYPAMVHLQLLGMIRVFRSGSRRDL